MKLYHFTAEHHLTGMAHGPHLSRGILASGLYPNAHPLIAVLTGVWLTSESQWQQVWSVRPVPGVNCDRTEVRIEIAVPKNERVCLWSLDRVLPFVRADWRDDFVDGVIGWS